MSTKPYTKACGNVGRSDRTRPARDGALCPTRRRFCSTLAGGLLFGASAGPLDGLLGLKDRYEPGFEPPLIGDGLSLLPDDVSDREPVHEWMAGSSRFLFLTFDDGPVNSTEYILDRLAETGQKATFFVIGRHLTNSKLFKLAVRAVKEGHELGNHSYSHPAFSSLGGVRVEKEIRSTYTLIDKVVEEAGGLPMRQNLFFRYPYGDEGTGAGNEAALETLAELGYYIAWWDLDTKDWRMVRSSDPRRRAYVLSTLNRARTRDVVLLHDRHPTARLLPELLGVLDAYGALSFPLSYYPASL